MKFILSYMKKHLGLVVLVMAVKLVGTFSELLIPYVLEHIIDDIAPLKQPRLIFLWGTMMVLLAVVVRFINAAANRGAVHIASKCIYSIRQDLFTRSVNLSGDQFDKVGLPSLVSRMTSDSYNLQSFIQSSQTLGIRAPIQLVGGIIMTLSMDRGLASILCILAPILMVVVFLISRKGIPLYDMVQTRLDNVVRIMRENITGVRVIKALSKEDYEKRRFDKANDQMTRDDMKASVVMALPGPVMSLAMNAGLTLVVLFGAYRVNKGVTKPGVILAFLTYFQMILMGVLTLNRFFLNMSKANASANRISSVMENEGSLKALDAASCPEAPSDDYIIFDNVSFSYLKDSVSNGSDGVAGGAEGSGGNFAGGERARTLENISFSMKKGSSLGIIGATGSGKTTIVNLLMRFYDPENGHVFIDGRDVRSYDLDGLRRHFGVVFQNDVLFADTVSNNIDFGRNVSEKAVKSAASDAIASTFIEAYEDGYSHMAAIHGANFSGGQRQRLLVARALAADPDILVLDDSSSALDYRTDSEMRRNINTNHSGTTTVIIAQRVSSVMNLDQIIMLEEGRILGIGSHEQLMASTPRYREIYETQMGEV